MIQIIPAILPTSQDQYQADAAKLAQAEALKDGWVHLDFMDNKFVPNRGIEPVETSKYPIPFTKEAHLMVQDPEEWINQVVKADCKRMLFHLESNGDKDQCISLAKKQGLEVGLALKHETPLDQLTPFVNKIDTILLMGVVPGFQGQPFIEGVIDKVKEAVSLRSENNASFRIGVDGAVRDTNIKQLADAGVDYVIIGSFLLKGDVEENLEKLWEAI